MSPFFFDSPLSILVKLFSLFLNFLEVVFLEVHLMCSQIFSSAHSTRIHYMVRKKVYSAHDFVYYLVVEVV